MGTSIKSEAVTSGVMDGNADPFRGVPWPGNKQFVLSECMLLGTCQGCPTINVFQIELPSHRLIIQLVFTATKSFAETGKQRSPQSGNETHQSLRV